LHTAAQDQSVRRLLLTHGRTMISYIVTELDLLTIYEKAKEGKNTNRDYSNRVSYSFREGSWVPGSKVFIGDENNLPSHSDPMSLIDSA
jgi:hypothetical protein